VFAGRHFAIGEFILRRRHSRIVTEGELAGLTPWERDHLCELDFDRFGDRGRPPATPSTAGAAVNAPPAVARAPV
jgi:hypothetical protein